jgi:hypothetical protein
VPLPTYLTEAQLAAYLHATLGPVADLMSYTVPASYAEPIAGTLLTLGWDAVTDADTATKTAQLRAVARWQAWQMVADQTAGYSSFSADGQSHQVNQVHVQAVARAAAAEMDALRLGVAVGGAAVSVVSVIHRHDPYSDLLDDEDKTWP